LLSRFPEPSAVYSICVPLYAILPSSRISTSVFGTSFPPFMPFFLSYTGFKMLRALRQKPKHFFFLFLFFPPFFAVRGMQLKDSSFQFSIFLSSSVGSNCPFPMRTEAPPSHFPRIRHAPGYAHFLPTRGSPFLPHRVTPLKVVGRVFPARLNAFLSVNQFSFLFLKFGSEGPLVRDSYLPLCFGASLFLDLSADPRDVFL